MGNTVDSMRPALEAEQRAGRKAQAESQSAPRRTGGLPIAHQIADHFVVIRFVLKAGARGRTYSSAGASGRSACSHTSECRELLAKYEGARTRLHVGHGELSSSLKQDILEAMPSGRKRSRSASAGPMAA